MRRTQEHLDTKRRKSPGDVHQNDLLTEKEASLSEGLAYLKSQLGYSDAKIGKLLRISKSTIQNWIRNGRVPLQEDGALTNDAECLIHLLAIHRSLEAMFEEPKAELEWLSLYREDLHSKPIDKIAASFEGILAVRQYLDYFRGRGA